jgi:hypothetical protein
MKLKPSDIMQTGDVIHWTNGSTLRITGLAGDMVSSIGKFGFYVDRPELLKLLDQIDVLLHEARKLAEEMK